MVFRSSTCCWDFGLRGRYTRERLGCSSGSGRHWRRYFFFSCWVICAHCPAQCPVAKKSCPGKLHDEPEPSTTPGAKRPPPSVFAAFAGLKSMLVTPCSSGRSSSTEPPIPAQLHDDDPSALPISAPSFFAPSTQTWFGVIFRTVYCTAAMRKPSSPSSASSPVAAASARLVLFRRADILLELETAAACFSFIPISPAPRPSPLLKAAPIPSATARNKSLLWPTKTMQPDCFCFSMRARMYFTSFRKKFLHTKEIASAFHCFDGGAPSPAPRT
mmetsp:Transcript_5283/g.13370  ORF Transcript_5283/g.13370 Transcript_5283/m.13370 type:complete len:273 (+) Transcript_5283:676-1494(+)